ncbi:phosphoenolpyruvate carboxylase [Candidatus Micrarchaeota archaeon]|nr:phosphoenolpyruvate carboxylase [Candidatus Micrarchaeota archaeon]
MTAERTIPRTMGTQHPDNASKPRWAQDAFIDTQTEVEEAYRCYSELDAHEFMWDWEGKHVDESVVEKLFENYTEFFQNTPLGRDIFLTTRLPNIWEEKGYRLPKAFVNVISANQMARDHGMHAPVLFEAILPMTKSADQLHFLHQRFRQVKKAFDAPDELELIPLVEETHAIQNVDQLLRQYVDKEPRESIRVFLARSDPALNSGNAAACLSVKAGLDRLQRFSEDTGIATHPILGVGSLPFRGGLNPATVDDFFKEYAGIRTVTVQSAFRYDYEPADVEAAMKKINEMPIQKAQSVPEGLDAVVDAFSAHYQRFIEGVAGTVNAVAAYVPKRRERRLHVGLFGYARKMQGITLPRAIAFCAAMYSLGVPPELLGAGSALAKMKVKQRDALYETYRFFEQDLERAGHYLNHENLHALARHDAGWEKVEQDVKTLEEQLGRKLGPKEDEHYIHRNLTSNVRLLLKSKADVSPEIVRAGQLRKSLG